MNNYERIIGSILGGAIGDAFGGPYEGISSPVTVDHQLEWRLSDDTQLTLATCEAISKSRRVDPVSLLNFFRVVNQSLSDHP
jgi:ADP-ribosylglycohydrolase